MSMSSIAVLASQLEIIVDPALLLRMIVRYRKYRKYVETESQRHRDVSVPVFPDNRCTLHADIGRKHSTRRSGIVLCTAWNTLQ